MMYINENKCKNVHKLVSESLKIYKKWNDQDAANNEFYRQQFKLPCDRQNNYQECEKFGKPVNPLDIIADNYQVITSAQNVKTHLWDFKFLEKNFGIKKSDFSSVEKICDKVKARKPNVKKVRAKCKKAIPTYVAIGLLYGKFMRDIDDWRLSARMGIETCGNVDADAVTKIMKILAVDNVTPLEMFFTNTY